MNLAVFKKLGLNKIFMICANFKLLYPLFTKCFRKISSITDKNGMKMFESEAIVRYETKQVA